MKKHSKLSHLWWGLKFQVKLAPQSSIIASLTYLISDFQTIINAFFLGLIVDKLIEVGHQPDKIDEILPLLLIFGTVHLFLVINTTITTSLDNYLNDKIPQETKKILFTSLSKLNITALEDPALNNKTTRVKENFRTFYYLLINFNIIFSTLIQLLVSGIRLSITFVYAAPILAISILPRIFLNKYFISKLWNINKKYTPRRRKADNVAAKLMDPKEMKEITLIGGFNYLENIYTSFFKKYFALILVVRQKWIFLSFLTRVVNYLAIGLIMYIFLKKVLNTEITPGEFVFLYALITQFNNALSSLITAFTNIYESLFKVEDMRDIFTINEVVTVQNNKSSLVSAAPSISLKNVSFSYKNNERSVLKNINLQINAGEKIAIVGENGAGKTTLVKLISGIYPPIEGEVNINNELLKSENISDWQGNLGLLFQDYNTYDDLTVWENIAIGDANSKALQREDIDFDRIVDAAKKADAYDFIQNYPNKFDQILSEKYKGGIRPSTGQWQKIAIARFFYRNSPVLILDEPTASIDAVAEAAIFNRIYEFIQNKTVIIISHRFSTVRNADRIIVLDKGEIIEEGTHAELLKHDGKYANAFKLQAKGYEG